MTQKRTFVIVMVLSVALIFGAYFLYQKLGDQFALSQLATVPKQTESYDPTDTTAVAKMPDFTVYDTNSNPVQLSDFIGKPVILNFWASWCGPCKSEMPTFQSAFDQYGEQIHFLMVNMIDGNQETLESACSFLTNAGYHFPVYFDLDSDAAIKYRVMSIPTTYFIDKDGFGRAWVSGALSADMLQQGIGMLLP